MVIDRDGGAAALRDLLAQARDRLQEVRQLVIFPEAHRGDPGVAGDYQPGVAGLSRDLELPTCPVATNSGVHWPAHGILRRPGTIVFEYLPPIPTGLKRAEFMRRLESAIETASNALLEFSFRPPLIPTNVGTQAGLGCRVAEACRRGGAAGIPLLTRRARRQRRARRRSI